MKEREKKKNTSIHTTSEKLKIYTCILMSIPTCTSTKGIATHLLCSPFFVCGQSRQHVNSPSNPGTARSGRTAMLNGVGIPSSASFPAAAAAADVPSLAPLPLFTSSALASALREVWLLTWKLVVHLKHFEPSRFDL
jgi:hypothetical protein